MDNLNDKQDYEEDANCLLTGFLCTVIYLYSDEGLISKHSLHFTILEKQIRSEKKKVKAKEKEKRQDHGRKCQWYR